MHTHFASIKSILPMCVLRLFIPVSTTAIETPLQDCHIIDAASIDVASHRGGNPSIGEASLSLGSGSQLEKLGRENDRESASNVALAGTSLAGSIASSVLPGGQRYYSFLVRTLGNAFVIDISDYMHTGWKFRLTLRLLNVLVYVARQLPQLLVCLKNP